MTSAVNAFNWNDMEALVSHCTEDVEAIPMEDWPDAPFYAGRDGFRELASAWWEIFAGTHMKIERLIEDGDRVVLLTTQTAVAGGAQLQQPLGDVIEMRDGLMAKLQFFIGFDETLAAAGLDPGRASDYID